MLSDARITNSRIRVFVVPTDAPEADGTCAWDKTTMVLAELESAGTRGIGYTYADPATARLADTLASELVNGQDAFAHGAILQSLYARVRNLGIGGIAMMAISAIDNALWDLRARLLNVPMVKMLGQVRDSIAVYGSGGFTSYNDGQLEKQLGAGLARGSPW